MSPLLALRQHSEKKLKWFEAGFADRIEVVVVVVVLTVRGLQSVVKAWSAKRIVESDVPVAKELELSTYLSS